MSNDTLVRERGANSVKVTRTAVQTVLRKSNPGIPNEIVRDAASAISTLWNILSQLPPAEFRVLSKDSDRLREVLTDVAAQAAPERVHIPATGPAVRKKGSGLGTRVSVREGRARLDRFVTPVSLESWAGPVAGAGEIEEQLSIPRSTLNAWLKRKAIIGLLRGERKLAYPLEQFIDARPLPGVADVLEVTPDARAAWLWFRQSHVALDNETPLAFLKRGGDRKRVALAARRDFA